MIGIQAINSFTGGCGAVTSRAGAGGRRVASHAQKISQPYIDNPLKSKHQRVYADVLGILK